jgi:hypothetical protein
MNIFFLKIIINVGFLIDASNIYQNNFNPKIKIDNKPLVPSKILEL